MQAVTQATARALARHDDLEIHVVCPSAERAQSRVWIDQGVSVHQVRVPRLPASVRATTVDCTAVARVIRNLRPHLIHAHSQEGHALAAVRSGRPTVVSVHGLLQAQNQLLQGPVVTRRLRSWLWTRAERSVLARARDVIVMSRHVADAVQRDSSAKAHWVRNPIDPSWGELPDEAVPGRVLFVGLITPRKDLETLLRAVPHLPAGAELRIAGAVHDEAYLERLKALARELSISARVRFTGRLSDDALRHEYKRATVFTLCSLEESAPIAIAQAMAAGKPVVATAAGGIPDLVVDGQTGFLVPLREPHALGACIDRVLTDSALRERFSLAGRERGRAHSPTRIAERLREVYAQVLVRQGIGLSIEDQRFALGVLTGAGALRRSESAPEAIAHEGEVLPCAQTSSSGRSSG